MKLYIAAFGKLKTPGLRDAADYYKKLIQPWAACEELELKPIAVPDKSPQTRLQIQKKEADLLLQKMKSNPSSRNVFILLDEIGKSKSTQEWSQQIKNLETHAATSVWFCIGSSLGFSKELKKQAYECLSLGPQTLPHELARVVLLEQLYRAYSVIKGHPYHNDGS